MPEGIEYEYSYPALLEKRITEGLSNRFVQVINAGVKGYGPVEQWPKLRELGPILKPDVVIYQFFVNEFSDVNATVQGLLDNIGLTLINESMQCDYAERSQIIRHVGNRMYSLIGKTTGRWRCIDSMNGICRDIGAKFVIFFVPAAIAVSKPHDIAYFPLDEDLTNQSVYYFERPFITLKKNSDSLRVPVVNLTPYLKEHPNQSV
jgi:hypothetical protein